MHVCFSHIFPPIALTLHLSLKALTKSKETNCKWLILFEKKGRVSYIDFNREKDNLFRATFQ